MAPVLHRCIQPQEIDGNPYRLRTFTGDTKVKGKKKCSSVKEKKKKKEQNWHVKLRKEHLDRIETFNAQSRLK